MQVDFSTVCCHSNVADWCQRFPSWSWGPLSSEPENWRTLAFLSLSSCSRYVFVCEAGIQSVQLSCVQLCDPWIAARQASLSITNSWSLLKLKSIESVMPSSHLILWRPLLLSPSIFPSIRVFYNDQFFASGGQSIGVSTSASVLPVNIQD